MPPSSRPRSISADRDRRLRTLAEIRRMPRNPRDILPIVRRARGWRRLGLDPWAGSVYLLFASLLGIGTLVAIVNLYITGFLPPKAAWIGDMRMAHSYADIPLTSAALAGDTWLVAGTGGAGIEAYRRASGHLGLWHTFTSERLGGALPSNDIRSIDANGEGVWYVAGDGLAWSSPDLDRWQQLVGLKGFSVAPRQAEIVSSALTADKTLMAVATTQTIGVYDTQHHNWIGEVTPGAPVRALAFAPEHRLVAGTASGLYAYRVEAAGISPEPALAFGDVAIKQLHVNPDWLFAITDRQGLLGLSSTADARWQWLIGEGGFQGAPNKLEQITAVSLDTQALWIASGGSVGRYTLTDHSWQTTQPDGSPVRALATFAGTTWAGTERGLYEFTQEKWQPIDQADGKGAKQFVTTGGRLWAVTADGALGSVGEDRRWRATIGSAAFNDGVKPSVTDVAVFDNQFWVASTSNGVASYDWSRRIWTDRRAGLLSAAVVDLHANANDLWALAASSSADKPPYSVWHWVGSRWETLTGTLGLQLATLNGSVWLLKDDGELTSLSPNSATTFFKAVKFNPSTLHALVYDRGGRRAIVAGDDGVFAYDLNSHSWEELSRTATSDLAWGNGALLQVTSGGGLIGTATLLPTGNSGVTIGNPVTATIWRDLVWMSDGKQVAQYAPASHTFTQAASINGATIRQLRTAADTVWALTVDAEKRNLYRYNESSRSWEQITQGVQLTGIAVLSDAIAYLDAEGGIHIASKTAREDYFSGAFAGMDSATAALQTSDGQIWMASPTAGVGRYDPARGSWNTFALSNTTQLAAISDATGDSVLSVGEGGLYRIRPSEKSASLLSGDVTGLAVLNGTPYVIARSPLRIARWNGSGLDTLQTFGEPTTELTDNGQVIRVPRPTELISSGGKLWARHGSMVVAYLPQGNTLSISEHFTLPAEEPTARLVEGDTRIPLYYGTPTACWELQSPDWAPCASSDMLAQQRSALNDHFGHSWQISTFAVRVGGSHSANGVFGSDRARDLHVDNNTTLTVQTDDGVWQAPLASPQDWSSRSRVGSGTFSKVPITDTLTPAGDPWSWTRVSDPSTFTDRLTIAWPSTPSILRQVEAGRFADDTANATAFFDGHFWLGTRAGVIELNDRGDTLKNSTLVTLAPLKPVTRMAATDSALFAMFEGGEIWQYQPSQGWAQGGTWPTLPPVSNELGTALLQLTPSGVQTAPMTQAAAPRFRQDQVLSLASDSQTVLLATVDGVLHTKLMPSGLSITGLGLRPTDPAMTIRLATDGQTVFAQQGSGASAKYFRFDGTTWQPGSLQTTPFAADALAPAQIPNVPLRWRRAQNGSTLDPILTLNGTQPIDWVAGRLAIDTVNAVAAGPDLLVLATQSGPYAYTPAGDVWRLSAAPDPATAVSMTEAGRGSDQFWAQTGDKAYVRLTINAATITSQPTSDASILIRPGVALQAGQWRWLDTSARAPLLAIEGLGADERPFADDGRFIFDRVNDAASGNGSILIGCDAGLLSYGQAPLTNRTSWDRLGNQAISRVTLEEGQMYALAGTQAYQFANNSWQPYDTARSALLPVGVAFDAQGWSSAHLERTALRVAGLEDREQLFAGNGKFIFDNILGVAATGEHVWLLTEAGWVAARHADTGSFARFEIFGATAPSPGFAARRVFIDLDNRLVAEDAERGQMLIWPVSDDRPGSPSQAAGPAAFHQEFRGYRVASAGESQVTIGPAEAATTLTSAAQWAWPFDLPLLHRSIPKIVSAVDDDQTVWIVTAEGLIAVDKGRLGIPNVPRNTTQPAPNDQARSAEPVVIARAPAQPTTQIAAVTVLPSPTMKSTTLATAAPTPVPIATVQATPTAQPTSAPTATTGPTPSTAVPTALIYYRFTAKQRLDGHSGQVWSVAFSPDGQLIASGSFDRTIKLWRVNDGALIRTLEGHTKGVLSVAFAPDSQTLASTSYDKTIKLWRVSDGTLIRTLEGHTDAILGVAFAPDGKTLASASYDKTIKLWRVSDGALTRTLESHTGEVLSVAFRADGQMLASGSHDQTIKLWQVSDGTLLRTLQGHTDYVHNVTFSPDGFTLASASGDKTVKLWRVSDGTLLRTLSDHTGAVRAVAFAPDGQVLASASDDRTVKLWRMSDGMVLDTLHEHTDAVWSVAFSPHELLLASSSVDKTVRLWKPQMEV